MTRYFLSLEAIGDSYSAFYKQMRKTPNFRRFDRKIIEAYRYGRPEMSPSVKIITGIKSDILQTKFVDKYVNYENSNTSGNRGILFCYFLEPGFYQITARLSLSEARSYYANVIDAETLVEISKAEVNKCLNLKHT